jgi:5-dehydro-2-deoxygluconokinase
LQSVARHCDLIVGTEEELHILGGSTDTLQALRRIRKQSDAVIVCKRGALGCVVFEAAIGASLDDGVTGRTFSIEVFNVLGAGDAFMSGFLRGWLRERPLAECCTWANACGALVVSRHGCAPAIPSWIELQYFLEQGSACRALRDDTRLEHIHWATNRNRDYESLRILAIDHRAQFEPLMSEFSAPLAKIGRLKELAIEAMHTIARGEPGFGILLDGRFGADALAKAADYDYWIGRPIENPGSRPLAFEGSPDVAMSIDEWPLTQTVKCLVNYRASDPPAMREAQERQLLRLFDACRKTRHELLLEVLCAEDGELEPGTVAAALTRIYDIGVFPDWWKLEPSDSVDEFAAISAVIDQRDPWCRGIVILGQSAPSEELLASFAAAAGFDRVKGFAVGRTIWMDPARAWLAGDIDDGECVNRIGRNFAVLADGWHAALQSSGRLSRKAG